VCKLGFFWPNDPDDNDDDPEEQEKNSQEEFPNSQTLMNSAHLYRSIQIIWIRLRYKEIKKSKTVNFYCIVEYPHRGHYVKKKTHPIALPLVWWCEKE
jgi:hypothetical protein